MENSETTEEIHPIVQAQRRPSTVSLPQQTQPVPSADKLTSSLTRTANSRALEEPGKPAKRPTSKLVHTKLVHTKKSEVNYADKLEKLLTTEGVAEFVSGQTLRSLVPSVSELQQGGTPSDAQASRRKRQGDSERGEKGRREKLVQGAGKTKEAERMKTIIERLGRIHGVNQAQTKMEYEREVNQQEDEQKRLRRENAALHEIADITQQNSLLIESRFAEELTRLQDKLEEAVLARLDDSEKMNQLRLTNRKIQDEVANVRSVAERQAQVEKENLVQAFTKQIELKARELELERRNGQNTTGEWLQRNQELQQQVNDLLARAEERHSKNRALMDLNKVLRVEFSAQEDDKVLLDQQLAAEKKRNVRLKDRIHELETQISELQKMQGESSVAQKAALPGKRIGKETETSFLSSLKEAAPGMTDAEKKEKYEDALQRVQKLAEVERQNLKQVQASHLQALSLRTELEILLRKAIEEVKEAISTRPAGQAEADDEGRTQQRPLSAAHDMPLSQFTAADRRRVIEVLLSKERVLHLLYSESKEAAEDPADEPQNQYQAADRSGEDTWSKWKQWSSSAEVDPAPTGVRTRPSRSR